MKKQDKDLVIQIEDMYGEECFGDTLSPNSNVPRKPQGRVEIFELDEYNKKKLISKSNLVVYMARELIAEKTVNENYVGITPDKDEFVCWFGLGDGGVAGGDPFDPLVPTNGDEDLASEVMIHETNSLLGDYRVATPGYYKIPFDSVEFEQDTANDDRWVVLKFTITVGATYVNDIQLSEAGLFTFANATPGLGSVGTFHLFSRVTFPSIVKTSTRRLLFVWYLYT